MRLAPNPLIGTKWTNKYTKKHAVVVLEPSFGVYELKYLDVKVENQNWCARDLYRHWERDDFPLDEEE